MRFLQSLSGWEFDMATEKNCLISIRSLYPSLFDAEKKIADFLLNQSESAVNMTVSQISVETCVADSSIIRFCQKLGFNGFTQLRINLARNLKRPEEVIFEDIERNDDAYAVATKVFASSIRTLEDTIKMLDGEILTKAVEALFRSKRIEFYGVGTSAPIAMDAYYRFMRIGLPAFVATDPHIARISANMLDSGCVAVGISHTGRTRDTIRILQIAKKKGAQIIGITSFMKSPVAELSDIKLITSSSETRIVREAVTSRIAQIALLDSLYTSVALKIYDTAIANISSMTDLLNETRV
jgi:RpiR family transcriptional regulator, carbohydrate utilization regulator